MKNRLQSSIGISILFWVAPLLLSVIQILFIVQAQHQIRYEELAESVRNVYFLRHRLVYDGVSSNVGWYGVLLVVYTLFGFTLYSALFVRLALYLVSMYLLALILKGYLGPALALVPLAIVGLSPTLLYFNAVETSFGTDLEFFIVCLFLVLSLNGRKRVQSYLVSGLLGFSAALACLCYPIFLDYLPALAITYVWRLQTTPSGGPREWLRLTGVAALSFLLPIAAVLGYVTNRSSLIYDSHTHGGLFRGGGNLRFNWADFAHAMSGVLNDLFVRGNSYYFNITKPEFSDYYPIAAVATIGLLSAFLVRKFRPLRLPLLLAFSSIVVTLLVVGVTSDGSGLPGMRRATTLLAGFYLCVVFVWAASVRAKLQPGLLRYLGMGACGLLLVHNVASLPTNLAAFPGPGATTDSVWFASAPTPQASLVILIRQAEAADLYLPCPKSGNERTPCRYNEVFAAIAGSCLWNNLGCHEIYGVNLKTNRYVPLNVGLWAEYEFQH